MFCDFTLRSVELKYCTVLSLFLVNDDSRDGRTESVISMTIVSVN